MSFNAADKASKAWALPRFWVSISSYEKQPVKKIWGRLLGHVWLKFAVAAMGGQILHDKHLGQMVQCILPKKNLMGRIEEDLNQMILRLA